MCRNYWNAFRRGCTWCSCRFRRLNSLRKPQHVCCSLVSLHARSYMNEFWCWGGHFWNRRRPTCQRGDHFWNLRRPTCRFFAVKMRCCSSRFPSAFPLLLVRRQWASMSCARMLVVVFALLQCFLHCSGALPMYLVRFSSVLFCALLAIDCCLYILWVAGILLALCCDIIRFLLNLFFLLSARKSSWQVCFRLFSGFLCSFSRSPHIVASVFSFLALQGYYWSFVVTFFVWLNLFSGFPRARALYVCMYQYISLFTCVFMCVWCVCVCACVCVCMWVTRSNKSGMKLHSVISCAGRTWLWTRKQCAKELSFIAGRMHV